MVSAGTYNAALCPATPRALPDAGASVALTDRSGRTPPELARSRGYLEREALGALLEAAVRR